MTVIASELCEDLTAPASIESEPASQSYDGNKAPDEIESDIRHTRRRLGATIDALERRLGPRRMLAGATESLLTVGEEESKQLVALLRENALPLLLITAAAFWLLLTRAQRNSDGFAARSWPRAARSWSPREELSLRRTAEVGAPQLAG